MTRPSAMGGLPTATLVLAIAIACGGTGGRLDSSTAKLTTSNSTFVGRIYGPIPDDKTALRIGENVLVAKYGRATIDNERPLVATLKVDVWTVAGTLPQGHVGGVAEVDIAKTDGRVIRLTHGL